MEAAALDPPARLEALFRKIHTTRMHDVPIVNPALQVECVDFRRWDGRWLGVLVTPWCMNLVLLADEPAAWRAARERETLDYLFPAGNFSFIGTVEPGFGDFQMCSLFSPMFEFGEHEVARATAAAALDALFTPPQSEPAVAPVDDEPPVPPDEAPASRSKRDFLRGHWSSAAKP
jgi:[NiFe] hydrogenase assembly HybE family chaperone